MDNTVKNDAIMAAMAVFIVGIIAIAIGATTYAIHSDKQRGETVRACITAGKDLDACARFK